VNIEPRKYFSIKGKCLAPFLVSFSLLLPNLIWIALDKGLWIGDPVGYALSSINLYDKLTTDLTQWKGYAFHYYKGPFVFWIGEFFVGIGLRIGSVNFALLFMSFVFTVIALILLFQSLELLFKSRFIALIGCMIVAASPLFNGLSKGYWIEPMQIAIVCWFIYAFVKASTWSLYLSLSQFIIASSLAILIKVSSPMYVVVPAIGFWIVVLRNQPSLRMTRKDLFLMLFSMLFFIPAVVFYIINLKDILGFAGFAATDPIFGSDISQYQIMMQNMDNGIFFSATYLLLQFLLTVGIVKTIWRKNYNDFAGIFIVAVFQLSIFIGAWLSSTNADGRLFMAMLPFFAILACWGLAIMRSRILNGLAIFIVLFQFIQVNATGFGWIHTDTFCPPMRLLETSPDRKVRLLQDLAPLATRDSSIIFDLSPDLGVAEFQFELAKRNPHSRWMTTCADVTTFFHFHRQEIDTARINIDEAWAGLLVYHPDYYITWQNRMSPPSETLIRKTDRYNAATINKRWAMTDKMKSSDLYELVSWPAYPELVVFKRKDLRVKKL
jgi:hypothetical protein